MSLHAQITVIDFVLCCSLRRHKSVKISAGVSVHFGSWRWHFFFSWVAPNYPAGRKVSAVPKLEATPFPAQGNLFSNLKWISFPEGKCEMSSLSTHPTCTAEVACMTVWWQTVRILTTNVNKSMEWKDKNDHWLSVTSSFTCWLDSSELKTF